MDCHFVTRSLCIGENPRDQSDLKQLQSMGITGILSLQSEEDIRDRGPNWEKSAAEAEGLTYRNVSVTDYDSLDLKWKLPSCVKALRELLCAGHRVYLHCTAGISRSPTVAVAYLHWCENWRLNEAVDHALQARPGCCPLEDVIRRATRPPEWGAS